MALSCLRSEYPDGVTVFSVVATGLLLMLTAMTPEGSKNGAPAQPVDNVHSKVLSGVSA